MTRDKKGAERRRGTWAERRASLYLRLRGLRRVASNYRCRYGEIDLIMRDGGTLVFVEVRLRTSYRFAGASASITPGKQARLRRAAQHYLQRANPRCPCRFDVVAFDHRWWPTHWLQGAFDADL
ncbi:MAG: YraN family protein [Pseudomonadota bacterium]